MKAIKIALQVISKLLSVRIASGNEEAILEREFSIRGPSNHRVHGGGFGTFGL